MTGKLFIPAYQLKKSRMVRMNTKQHMNIYLGVSVMGNAECSNCERNGKKLVDVVAEKSFMLIHEFILCQTKKI